MTARLRIQELPSEVDGDTVTYPFIWVLDRVGDLSVDERLQTVEHLRTQGGAHCRGALVFADVVELDALELAGDARPAGDA